MLIFSIDISAVRAEGGEGKWWGGGVEERKNIINYPIGLFG
jgi:hypothetical protein